MKFVRPQTDKYLHQVEVEVESRLACCNHSRQQCYCNGLISQPKCDSSLLITHLTGVIWGKDDYSKKLPNNRLWRVISVRVFQVKLEQWYKGRPWPSSSSCSFVSDRKYNSQRKLKAFSSVYMGTFLWVLTQGVKIKLGSQIITGFLNLFFLNRKCGQPTSKEDVLMSYTAPKNVSIILFNSYYYCNLYDKMNSQIIYEGGYRDFFFFFLPPWLSYQILLQTSMKEYLILMTQWLCSSPPYHFSCL